MAYIPTNDLDTSDGEPLRFLCLSGSLDCLVDLFGAATGTATRYTVVDVARPLRFSDITPALCDLRLEPLRCSIRELERAVVRLLNGYRPAVPYPAYRAPRPSIALNAGMHWRRLRRSAGLARART